MAEGNTFVNDGGFMARFLASRQRKGGEGEAASLPSTSVVGAAASDERVRASVARNDGSFLAAFLAMQREAAAKPARANDDKDAVGGSSGQESSSTRAEASGGTDDARPRRRKRSRWDAGPRASAPAAVAEEGAMPTVETVDEDEALRSVRAKQQKHREELRFLEQRIRGLQQQAVVSAATEAKKDAEAALAEERRQEYARLAERAERERDYRDTMEDAELGVVRDGTHEHRRRAREMLQTLETAAATTARTEGKHHLGDFLPEAELERFMQQERPKALASQAVASTGATSETSGAQAGEDEFDQYRKRMMLAYRFRPNPLNNPRRSYY